MPRRKTKKSATPKKRVVRRMRKALLRKAGEEAGLPRSLMALLEGRGLGPGAEEEAKPTRRKRRKKR